MQLSQTVLARQARVARPVYALSSRSAYMGTRIQRNKALGEFNERQTALQGLEGPARGGGGAGQPAGGWRRPTCLHLVVEQCQPPLLV